MLHTTDIYSHTLDNIIESKLTLCQNQKKTFPIWFFNSFSNKVPETQFHARNMGLMFVWVGVCNTFVETEEVEIIEWYQSCICRGTLIEGATALWSAACAGYVDVVEELTKAGADPNTKSLGTSRSPALRVACLEGKNAVSKTHCESIYHSTNLFASLSFREWRHLVELEGPDVSNGSLPKVLGLFVSTKAGFTSIHTFYFEIWSQTWGASMHGEMNHKNDCFNNFNLNDYENIWNDAMPGSPLICIKLM